MIRIQIITENQNKASNDHEESQLKFWMNVIRRQPASFTESSTAVRHLKTFYSLGSKVSYKLECFLNSRLKLLKSFLANETLI